MALVVLLRGVNVGGHRTFRPATFVKQFAHLDAVNIGAAGTFVIRRPVAETRLRAELKRRLPFATDLMICPGRDFVRLASRSHFADYPPRPDVVRFVSVLGAVPRGMAALPVTLPERGRWLLKIIARERRMVVGVYRRHMKVIGYLGQMDRIFGVPATTRNWNAVTAIVQALGG